MAATPILDSDQQLLADLAKATGLKQEEILHDALDRYHRDFLLDGINTAFARMKGNAVLWAGERDERAVWEATSGDGDRPE